MPQIEHTDQGEQYVLPGTERRTVPGLPYAAEPDGQLTLPFYAPPGEDERRVRPSGAPPMVDRVSNKEDAKRTNGLFGRRLAHFPHAFDPA